MSSAPQEIDWSVYRQPELVEHVSGVLNVTNNLFTLAKCVLCSLLFFLSGTIWLLSGTVHWSWLIAALLYACLGAAVLGIIIGLLVALGSALDSLIEILTLAIGLARQAAEDFHGVRDGRRRIPTVGQLIYAALDQVVMPIVESVVQGRSRWLGRVVIGVYRRTLHRMVRRMLKKAVAPQERGRIDRQETGEPSKPDGPAPTDQPLNDARVAEAERQASSLITGLELARRYVVSMGGGARAVLLTPLTIAAVLAACVVASPLALLWWFA